MCIQNKNLFQQEENTGPFMIETVNVINLLIDPGIDIILKAQYRPLLLTDLASNSGHS